MSEGHLYQDSGYYNRHSLRNKLGRMLWAVVYGLLFRLGVRWFGNTWRRKLLCLFGAEVGAGSMHPSVKVWAPWNLKIGAGCAISAAVDCYCVAPITVGGHVTLSREVFLCTASHDITSPHMELVTAPIVIGDNAWVCARAFIGPGVTIGEGAVVAACAVVTKDVEPWTVVWGNPAQFIKRRELADRAPDRS